jgi:transcriptional regulator with XRE-family HTH domain
MRQRRFQEGVRAGQENGYSQEYVAGVAGITQAQISYWESDTRRPTLWGLAAIASIYRMTVEAAFPEFRMTTRERRQVKGARFA